jgi:thiamine-phosphate pyrophosphorylase
MPTPIQLYYITDRTAFAGNEASRRQHLLNKIAEAARASVDYIQLREKDLSTGDLEKLALEAVQILRQIHLETRNPKLETKLLINSRTDVALAIEADGIHLRADDISPREAAAIQSVARKNSKLETRNFLTAVSCHSVEDVRRAEREGASFAVLAPVFEKIIPPQATALGLDKLRRSSEGKLPVFALGGVTLEKASACLDAGAAGIAAIRLFQNNNIQEIVRQLRQP